MRIRYLLPVLFFMFHSIVFASQDVINGLVVEDSVVADELGDQYYTKMVYPSGVTPNSLALHIIQTNHVPPKFRMAIMGTGNLLPINEPGIDDTIPAFYVHGDVAAGDQFCIGNAPMRIHKRIETDLPASSVTTLYSAKYAAKDVDGGAFVQYSPCDESGWNDGYINLTAFGRGQGVLANTVFFRARKDENTIEEIASFNGRNRISLGQTSMSLMVHDGDNLRFERVFIGAPDSGGPGKRVLTINN